MHDAVRVETLKKPAIAAICDEFLTHGKNMSIFLGHPDLKVLVFPYPLEGRPDDELRGIAKEWYPKFLAMLGVTP